MKLPYCTKATKKKHVIWQIRAKITKRQKSANKRKPLLEQTPTKEYGWFDYRVFRLRYDNKLGSNAVYYFVLQTLANT